MTAMTVRDAINNYSVHAGESGAMEDALAEIRAVMPSEQEIFDAMQKVSNEKQEQQIAEVEKKGLWGADLITIELSELATAIRELMISKLQ